MSLVFLLVFASLLSSLQQAQVQSNQAVKQACITLSDDASQDIANGDWQNFDSSSQQSGYASLQQCVSEGYLSSNPITTTSESSPSTSFSSLTSTTFNSNQALANLESINNQAAAVGAQGESLWASWQNGTIDANQFGNQTENIETQLKAIGNEMANASIPAEWQTSYGDYGASLAVLIQAYQLEVIYAHATYASSAAQVEALNLITADLNQATQDVLLSEAVMPSG
jgi:hypothetical protein